MFNTMTITKTVGALCGALLIYLLINWAAEALYHGGSENAEDGHQGYVIDTGAEPAPEAAAPAVVPFADYLAKADIAKGEKVFSKCKACHKINGKNATGPHLNGVVGRDTASVADFSYSDALKGLGDTWTPERINTFLTSPKAFAPGTKMTFAGLKKEQDRANVIAYLSSLGG